jgi:hypothetical protein
VNLTASLALVVASIALLYFGRGRDGDAPNPSELDSRHAVRHDDNVSIHRRSHGRGCKLELAITERRIRSYFGEQPTNAGDAWMSALCQKRTSKRVEMVVRASSFLGLCQGV